MSKIAQKLNMPKDKLVRLNPDVIGDPKKNTFIVVPEDKLQDYKNKTSKEVQIDKDSTLIKEIDSNRSQDSLIVAREFETYKVTKGDTFFNIEKRYGVTKEELLLLNPELSEGLEIGMILKFREIKENIITEELYEDYIDAYKKLSVSLLLPFKSYNYNADTLSLKEIFVKDATLLNIVTDFYLGAEIAVDSLRKRGIDIELNVFDTGERNSNSINFLLSDNNFTSSDVIIGPLYSSEVESVALNTNVPVIFPVYSKNQSKFRSSNIVKTSPEVNLKIEELKSHITENFIEGNLIIVSDESPDSSFNAFNLQSSLEREIRVPVSLIKPIEGYIEKERFLELLKPNTNNWVIICSTNQVITSDAINSLISLPEETTARVFAFSKGKAFDKVDNSKLASLEFTYVSEYFYDDSSIEMINFKNQYLDKNKALPSDYAIKGFDITFDILMRMASGKTLYHTFDEGVSKRVESKFDYRNSSYMAENKGLFILKYNKDLTIEKLK